MYLGVDYYPEYWPEKLIDDDIVGISELGANIVRIGEFAWHKMESIEGQYNFSFYDEIITRLEKSNLKVMFGTPTATFPAWLAHKHPSILGKEIDGTTRVFGGRRQYCFNSEIYKQYSMKITKELVRHFASNATIVSWQIDNEFGHEGSDMCYCEQCHEAFQTFLANKFEHNIDQLNETYGTIFWGQTYNDFQEIPMPVHTITVHNPALQLDWARFRSFSVNQFGLEMVNVVRQLKGDHQTITHNFAGGFFDNKWFDYAEHAEMLDFASYDNYPVWGGLANPISPAEIALGHDFIRGLKQQNFWIVEELMGAQGHDIIGFLPRPNQAKMWSFQAFAHGCSNMLYFNWRAMTKGAEQFCMGIVDHDNVRGQKYEEVKQVFTEIAAYDELLQAPIESEIAVLYDYDNIWSWRFQRQSEGFSFKDELLNMYAAFYRYHVSIDVIPITRNLASYKVLIIPALQIMTEQLAERLKIFVAEGGTILLGFRTSTRDQHNNVYFDKRFPAWLDELAGITLRGVEALANEKYIQIISCENSDDVATCRVWRDLIEPTTAKALYRYDDPFYPYAAVTHHEYGLGEAYYIGGGMNEELLQKIARSALERQKITYIESEVGLEIVTRYNGEDGYTFIMNHTEQQKTWKQYVLQPYETIIVAKELS